MSLCSAESRQMKHGKIQFDLSRLSVLDLLSMMRRSEHAADMSGSDYAYQMLLLMNKCCDDDIFEYSTADLTAIVDDFREAIIRYFKPKREVENITGDEPMLSQGGASHEKKR